MKISRVQIKWLVLLISIGLYIYSLTLPALLLKDEAPIEGGWVLALGWWGLLMYQFAWLANPAYFVGIFAYVIANLDDSKGFSRAVLILAGIALILGVTSYRADVWYQGGGGPDIPIIGLGAGFYVWMLSFCLLLAAWFISPRAYHARAI